MRLPADSDGFNLPSLVGAVLLVAIVGATIVFTDDPIGPLYGLSIAIALVFLLATSLESVRDHDLYYLATSFVLTALFGLWWFAADGATSLPALLVALGVCAVVVELYNYRFGTSYLRPSS